MTEKKKVAYQVDRDDYEGSVVVFDTHGLAARRIGASELGTDFECCVSSRAKHFDEFAELGFVPVKNLLEHGWWYESLDGFTLKEETDEEEMLFYKNEPENDYGYCGYYCKEWLVFSQDQKSVYFNWEGMLDNAYEMNESFDKFVYFKEQVKEKLAEFEILGYTGGYPSITFIATLKFPDMQYNAHVRWDSDQPFPEDFGKTVYVAQGDLETFSKWRESLKNEE